MFIKDFPEIPVSATPFELWETGMEIAMLGQEAQMVIALRLLGMSGIWAVTPSENHRMLAEKPVAFARAANAAMQAAANGKRPDEVLSAAVKPLRKRTASNMRRLSRNGPKVPFL